MSFLVNLIIIGLVWTSVQCSNPRDKMFFLQKTSGEEPQTLLVVTWKEGESEISAGCEVFKDKGLIREVLQSSDNAQIRKLSDEQMQNVIKDCTEFTLRRRRRETDETDDDEDSAELPMEYVDNDPKELRRNRNTNGKPQQNGRPRNTEVDRQAAPKEVTTTESTSTVAGYDGIPVIFPGTKWCGAGDKAKHYNDLGYHQDTDRCCRAHDLCNDTLAPGETRHNITNKSSFTKLHCKCDKDFYDCLDRVNSVTSNTIGNMYFNILKRDCYRKDYPLTDKCKKYKTFLKISCVEYARDIKSPKVFQWEPAKKYKKIPFPGPLTVTLPF